MKVMIKLMSSQILNAAFSLNLTIFKTLILNWTQNTLF